MLALAVLASALPAAAARTAAESAAAVAERNAANPFATYSTAALSPHNVGGCYTGKAPSPLEAAASGSKFSFTDEELRVVRSLAPCLLSSRVVFRAKLADACCWGWRAAAGTRRGACGISGGQLARDRAAVGRQ